MRAALGVLVDEKNEHELPMCACSPESQLYPRGGERHFTRTFVTIRGNGLKLKEGRFRLDVRKKHFTTKVVRHCHRLSREAAGAPSLEAFQTWLDGHLGSLV